MKLNSTVKRKKIAGFTIIEMLVVVAVIGILAAVVLASLNEARQQSRDNGRVAHLDQIKLALKLYKEAKGEFPDDLGMAYESNIEIGVSESIDSDLEPFVANLNADPLAEPSGGGDYGYYYDNLRSCGGDNRVVVFVKKLENDKYNNNWNNGKPNASDCVGNDYEYIITVD